MKKSVIIPALIPVVLLSLAATHDILKGEPDLTSEYIILGSSVIILAAMMIKPRSRKGGAEKPI